MIEWKVIFIEEAKKDLKRLDGNQKIEVYKALKKVSLNPVSIFNGGYGKPLGNKNNINLNGYYKIKLKKSGLRIVYELVEIDNKMFIIVIGARSDEKVYKLAEQRKMKQKSH
ncbi:type II toxin-antitoxin system RelE family toxin [Thomasclavelia ramosa]|uniref:Type II toxin-antitoxin system RelE/ParE family toxin n=1 Tax=Thomasclavelia ramosa TaxID=1547 RepID=A0A3E3E4W2_9FIRM|nr:type II toxin-antitoxin system RelE/ParE family toxin [Thomasclavelia ramosa]RGD76646.1 type II toxin-antitoxin system RelE/ParE family toxin [Thomasclavelia ramosa]